MLHSIMEVQSMAINDAVKQARWLLARRQIAEAEIQAADGDADAECTTATEEDDDLELPSLSKSLSLQSSLFPLDGMHGRGEREDINGSTVVQPRKVHSLRLSEFRWCVPVDCHKEQRVALLLRAVPWKLCSPIKLKELLHKVGFGEMVEDLQVRPAKPGHPGCAVLKVLAISSDVQRIVRFFHGRQFGTSMPMAVSLASPGAAARRMHRGTYPAKVPSSLWNCGTASEPLFAAKHGDTDREEPSFARLKVGPNSSKFCCRTMDVASAGSTSAGDSPRR